MSWQARAADSRTPGRKPRPALAPVDLVVRVPRVADGRLGDLVGRRRVAEGTSRTWITPCSGSLPNTRTVDLAAGWAWPQRIRRHVHQQPVVVQVRPCGDGVGPAVGVHGLPVAIVYRTTPQATR